MRHNLEEQSSDFLLVLIRQHQTSNTKNLNKYEVFHQRAHWTPLKGLKLRFFTLPRTRHELETNRFVIIARACYLVTNLRGFSINGAILATIQLGTTKKLGWPPKSKVRVFNASYWAASEMAVPHWMFSESVPRRVRKPKRKFRFNLLCVGEAQT